MSSIEHKRTASRQPVEPPHSGKLPQYRRERDLPRLLPVWPSEIADHSLAARSRLVALLRKALRAERQRGLAGHWTYDLARHNQLLAAWRYEVAALETAPRPALSRAASDASSA